MSRIARIVEVGYPYHVTQRGNNKQVIFFDDQDRGFYLKLVRRYSLECSCSIHAYCLMSNHVHILTTPQENSSLSKTMQKLSLSYTQYINKRYGRTGRLWECRFHSTLIDEEAYLWIVCRYIERNPVRAGIVSDPAQYGWSSVKINTKGLKNSFVEPVWQRYGERGDIQEYIEFLNAQDNGDDVEKIREATFKGKPLGSKKFLDRLGGILGSVINTRPRGRPRKME